MYVKKMALRTLDDVTRALTRGAGSGGDVDQRYFTPAELDYCGRRLRSLGARLLIKDCVFDHLESAFGYMERQYSEIEVVNNQLKRPMLSLFDGLDECVRRSKITDIRIAISHSRNWIATMVLFCY